MDRELQKYNYSEYYSKIRGQMNNKVALLTKDNCEYIRGSNSSSDQGQ